jgi:hypothetical protein
MLTIDPRASRLTTAHATLSASHRALTQLLSQHRALWNERPFVRGALTWPARYPKIAEWLTSLSEDELTAAERGTFPPDTQPVALAEWVNATMAGNRIERWQRSDSNQRNQVPWQTSPRKAEQATAFAEVVSRFRPPEAPILEWCAGKGYLARRLNSTYQAATTCVERDALICASGQELDQRAAVRSTWLTADVKSLDKIDPGNCVVALHACGSLYRHLIRVAAESGCRQIAFAPCCYQKGLTPPAAALSQSETHGLPTPRPAATYVPLSATARRTDLHLNEHALRLATADRVFLKRRVVRARHREQLYRLSLDLWLRRTTGIRDYHPVPRLRQCEFREELDVFIRRIAKRFDLSCPTTSLVGLEAEARRELKRVRGLELVRRLFRRSLELWVVLDSALYLEERGYEVQVGEFVAPNVTPRNLLVLARNPAEKCDHE